MNISLSEYYKTPHWRKLSKLLLDDKECECEICHRKRWKLLTRGKNKGTWKRTRRFSVHHKSYKHLFEEDKNKEDLMILCNTCHDICHTIIRYKGISIFFEKLHEVVIKFGFEYEKEEKKIDNRKSQPESKKNISR